MIEKERFHFTLKVLFRILIFALIIYLSIIWLSSKQDSAPILGDTTTLIDEDTKNDFVNDLYQKLPDRSRQQLENFEETSLFLYFQEKVSFIQQQTDGFPDRQIKEVQKAIIKKVSQEMVNSIEEN